VAGLRDDLAAADHVAVVLEEALGQTDSAQQS